MKRCLTLILSLLVAGTVAVAQAPNPLPSRILDKIPEQMRAHVPMYSGNVAIRKAMLYNMDLQGKALSQPVGIFVPQRPKKLTDVPIADYADPAGYALREDTPYIAINPANKKIMVAVSTAFDPGYDSDACTVYNPCMTPCVAYVSSDGGATWSSGVTMGYLYGWGGDNFCSDPVVAYSPDGKRVYMAYLDSESYSFVDDDGEGISCSNYWEGTFVQLVYSDDNGSNWWGLDRPLTGDPTYIWDCQDYETGEEWGDSHYGFDYDKPWLATSSFDPSQSNYVYLTATWGFGDGIVFTRSADRGETFDAPKVLETGYAPNTNSSGAVQGSRPVSGVGPGVLVAWYSSGNDDWTGGFQIHTAYSPDNGATFNPVVVAVRDQYKLPYWLGSNGMWWTGMFPSIAMDGNNKLHIAYAASPTPDWSSSEAGDIRYLSSSRAPYRNYTMPITVNQDHLLTAQGFPAIAVEKQGTVHLTWEDHRMSPNLDNSLYGIYYARKVPGAASFSKEQMVSDTPSLSSNLIGGEYNGLAVNGSTIFAVWTDRRVDSSIWDYNNDVYGSRVIPKQ